MNNSKRTLEMLQISENRRNAILNTLCLLKSLKRLEIFKDLLELNLLTSFASRLCFCPSSQHLLKHEIHVTINTTEEIPSTIKLQLFRKVK